MTTLVKSFPFSHLMLCNKLSLDKIHRLFVWFSNLLTEHTRFKKRINRTKLKYLYFFYHFLFPKYWRTQNADRYSETTLYHYHVFLWTKYILYSRIYTILKINAYVSLSHNNEPCKIKYNWFCTLPIFYTTFLLKILHIFPMFIIHFILKSTITT
jgi:hypothetical protein